MFPATLTRIIIRCVALFIVLFAAQHFAFLSSFTTFIDQHLLPIFCPYGTTGKYSIIPVIGISSRWDEHPVASPPAGGSQ